MKVVQLGPEELETQMLQAGTEAKAAFGDATVYLEKYLGNPRHIEFQVFGDGNGKAQSISASVIARSNAATRKCLKKPPPPSSPKEERARMGKVVCGRNGRHGLSWCWHH